MQRNLKFTPMQVERILEMVRGGAYVSVVAKRIGIPLHSIWHAVHHAEADPDAASPELVDFAKKFRAAEAEAEMFLVARIRQAAEEDPKWAAWLLEKRFPKRWATAGPEYREAAEPPAEAKALPLEKARELARKSKLRVAGGTK